VTCIECIITYDMSIPSAAMRVLSAVFFRCSRVGNNCQLQLCCVLSALVQHVSSYQGAIKRQIIMQVA